MSGLNTKTQPAPQDVDLLPGTSKIDPDSETVSQFENRVATAAMAGDEWLETSPKILDLIMRGKSWSPPGYIVYKNVKVCPTGSQEALERGEAIQLGQRLLGDKPVING